MKRVAVGAALALLVAACSHGAPDPVFPWTMYQSAPTHNAVVAAPFPGAKWNVNLGSKINGGFAYSGTALYAVDFAHELVALDPRNGGIFWRAQADDVLMSTPVVADGLVFVGSGTNDVLVDEPGRVVWGRKAGNHVYAFGATDGKERWSFATPGQAMPSAAYADGKLYFGTGDALATAVESKTGKVLWQTKLPGIPTMSSAAIDGDSLYLSVSLGKADFNNRLRSHTVALRLRDGVIRWSAPYGNGDCAPTVAQGLVFVESAWDGPVGPLEATGTNDVVALDERTGAVKWRYVSAKGFYNAVGSNERAIAGVYANGTLYQSVPATSELIAFHASDGRQLWSLHTSGPIKMSAVVDRDHLYAGDTSGMLYDLDARSGAVRGAVPYGRPFTTAPPLLIGQTLFIANTDTIRAIPLSSPQP